MNNRLDHFNFLPPKPEYIDKVRAALVKRGKATRLADLVASTGLSRTQALCALQAMVRDGEVFKEKGANTFCIVPTDAPLTTPHGSGEC
jgi:hypothetical protein